MDQGNLVPDEVIIGIVRDRLAEPDCANGYTSTVCPARSRRPRPL